MENCLDDLCKNNGTCDDRGGYFYCFCTGLYYGEICEDCKHVEQLIPLCFMSHKVDVGKQCRPTSNAAQGGL